MTVADNLRTTGATEKDASVVIGGKETTCRCARAR